MARILITDGIDKEVETVLNEIGYETGERVSAKRTGNQINEYAGLDRAHAPIYGRRVLAGSVIEKAAAQMRNYNGAASMERWRSRPIRKRSNAGEGEMICLVYRKS